MQEQNGLAWQQQNSSVKKHALLQQLPTRCRFHRDTDHHQNCMFKGEAGGSVSTASPV